LAGESAALVLISLSIQKFRASNHLLVCWIAWLVVGFECEI